MTSTSEHTTSPAADPVRAALADPDTWSRLHVQALSRLNRWLADRPIARRVQEVDEIVQTTLERALAKSATFDPTRSEVGAWLHGVLVNVLSETCRAIRKQPPQACVERLPASDRPAEPDEIDVPALLDHLTPDDRACVEMHYLNNLSHRQIADRLGLKEGTARVRLYRAITKLRHAAGEAGR